MDPVTAIPLPQDLEPDQQAMLKKLQDGEELVSESVTRYVDAWCRVQQQVYS